MAINIQDGNSFPCRSGGIGRRAWFRSMYPQGCGGSSPFFGTSSLEVLRCAQDFACGLAQRSRPQDGSSSSPFFGTKPLGVLGCAQEFALRVPAALMTAEPGAYGPVILSRRCAFRGSFGLDLPGGWQRCAAGSQHKLLVGCEGSWLLNREEVRGNVSP